MPKIRQRYSADYYNFELGANVKPVAFGAGYEVLGSGANSGTGGGRLGFKTPLATLHPFNGWAEVFLTQPNNGLRTSTDTRSGLCPGRSRSASSITNTTPDYGSGDYGQEFDLMTSRKFGKNWTVMVECADYHGQDVAAPVG